MPEPRAGGRGLLLAVLAAALIWGCARRPPLPTDQPPQVFMRHLILVLEWADYRPAAGLAVNIQTGPTARLVSPAEGRGRTDSQGRLELIFAPRPQPDAAARAGGDIIVDYPIQALLTLPDGRVLDLDDREVFARYADARYQGLNRDPEPGPVYYLISLP